jgi:hypothetical protein
MNENKNSKSTRGVTLRTPADGRRILKRLVDTAFKGGEELAYMGKITNALVCWAKLWELEKVSEIEKRLEVLEREKKNDQD